MPRLSMHLVQELIIGTVGLNIQCQHFIFALNTWAWMTPHLNIALVRKLPRPVVCLAYSFDMLSMGVCTIVKIHRFSKFQITHMCNQIFIFCNYTWL